MAITFYAFIGVSTFCNLHMQLPTGFSNMQKINREKQQNEKSKRNVIYIETLYILTDESTLEWGWIPLMYRCKEIKENKVSTIPQLWKFCYDFIATGGVRNDTFPVYSAHHITTTSPLELALYYLQLCCNPTLTPFLPVALSAYMASHPLDFFLYVLLPIRFPNMQT